MNLAKFHNAAMEYSGCKAAVHNLIRGSFSLQMESNDYHRGKVKPWLEQFFLKNSLDLAMIGRFRMCTS